MVPTYLDSNMYRLREGATQNGTIKEQKKKKKKKTP